MAFHAYAWAAINIMANPILLRILDMTHMLLTLSINETRAPTEQFTDKYRVFSNDYIQRDRLYRTITNSVQETLASCLIYARTFIEYVCGCVLFQDVTVREIRGR